MINVRLKLTDFVLADTMMDWCTDKFGPVASRWTIRYSNVIVDPITFESVNVMNFSFVDEKDATLFILRWQ